jgi:hypothetical protein
MRRVPTLLLMLVAALALGGCSLVVDFDRSLLVDGGVDAGLGGGGGRGGAGAVGGGGGVGGQGGAGAN